MPTPFTLDETRLRRAQTAATGAREFVVRSDLPLGRAMIDHAWSGGSAAAVSELARYQNDDGGFGRGLEVDIESPASNPFAARLAMSILLGLDERPATGMEEALREWLVLNQHGDGDWHFSDAIRAGNLAPWFADWTFPSLNPACCLAGLANRLGLATPGMLERLARLFAGKATVDEARTGDFYSLLPYVEYAGGVEWDDRDAYLDAIAINIAARNADGSYADAGHFWEHVLGGEPDLARRLPPDILAKNADALLEEQEPDGGWPTPYSAAWRPLLTAQACVTLARLRDGV